MPFIGSSRVQFPTPEIIIYLDRLQIVSCDEIVTLRAFVPITTIGIKTIIWEQISGLVVVWLTPLDDYVVMFEETLVRDDKIFRFYVNKGSDSEVYADILVTAVPRDYIPEIKHAPRQYTQSFQKQSYADEEVVKGVVIPGLSASDTVSVNNPLRGFMFTSSPKVSYGYYPMIQYIKSFNVYDVTGGVSQTLLGSFPVPMNGYFNFPSYRSIRVDTIVQQQPDIHLHIEKTHTAKGIPAGWFPPQPSGAGMNDMDTFVPGKVHLQQGNRLFQSFTSIIYTTVTTSDGTNLYQALMKQSKPIYETYQRYPLSLNFAPTQSDPFFVHLMQSNHLYRTVTRLNLGAGGIGSNTIVTIG